MIAALILIALFIIIAKLIQKALKLLETLLNYEEDTNTNSSDTIAE